MAFTLSRVWTNPPHITFPASDDFIFWMRAQLYPNGDLLAMYIGVGDTPAGYGLVKVDKDSRMIWKYAERVHHDLDVGSDGKIYTLIQEITTEKIPGIKLEPPLMYDSIVLLSADGQEIKRLSITEAFSHSDYSNVLRLLVQEGESFRTTQKSKKSDFFKKSDFSVVWIFPPSCTSRSSNRELFAHKHNRSS